MIAKQLFTSDAHDIILYSIQYGVPQIIINSSQVIEDIFGVNSEISKNQKKIISKIISISEIVKEKVDLYNLDLDEFVTDKSMLDYLSDKDEDLNFEIKNLNYDLFERKFLFIWEKIQDFIQLKINKKELVSLIYITLRE